MNVSHILLAAHFLHLLYTGLLLLRVRNIIYTTSGADRSCACLSLQRVMLPRSGGSAPVTCRKAVSPPATSPPTNSPPPNLADHANLAAPGRCTLCRLCSAKPQPISRCLLTHCCLLSASTYAARQSSLPADVRRNSGGGGGRKSRR